MLTEIIWGWIVTLAIMGVICGAIGYAIGSGKGRGPAGFWLGLLLGVFGIIIVAVMAPSEEHRIADAIRIDEAVREANGTKVAGRSRVNTRQGMAGTSSVRDPAPTVSSTNTSAATQELVATARARYATDLNIAVEDDALMEVADDDPDAFWVSAWILVER